MRRVLPFVFVFILLCVAASVPAQAQESMLLWARRAGGSSYDCGSGIAALSDGGALVSGRFYGSATFGSGEPNATTLTSEGDKDIFVAKYNPDGTLAWARHAGGSQNDYGYGIAALSNGSALVTGYFYGSATFGSGEANATTLTSEGSGEIFVAKYGQATTTHTLSVQSTPVTRVSITGTPAGTTNYAQQVADNSQVSLTAPATVESGDALYDFVHWTLNDAAQPEGQTTVAFSLTEHVMVVAAYRIRCVGDFCGADFGARDGYVDIWDLSYLADRWHLHEGGANWDAQCDLSGAGFQAADGYVDVWDLSVFSDHWHEGQEPE